MFEFHTFVCHIPVKSGLLQCGSIWFGSHACCLTSNPQATFTYSCSHGLYCCFCGIHCCLWNGLCYSFLPVTITFPCLSLVTLAFFSETAFFEYAYLYCLCLPSWLFLLTPCFVTCISEDNTNVCFYLTIHSLCITCVCAIYIIIVNSGWLYTRYRSVTQVTSADVYAFIHVVSD